MHNSILHEQSSIDQLINNDPLNTSSIIASDIKKNRSNGDKKSNLSSSFDLSHGELTLEVKECQI